MEGCWTHEIATTAHGELELVSRFIGLHDHRVGTTADLPPSPETLRRFLAAHDLIDDGEELSGADFGRIERLRAALRAKVHGNQGAPVHPEAVVAIDRAAAAARFEPRFSAHGPPRLEPRAGGVPGALGRILAAVFIAELDGSWSKLKECASDECRAVFADGSKNHSGKWCSMRVCGNRRKVRAYRARARARAQRD